MLMIKLSLWQKLLLKINGAVFIGYEKREGWTEANAIFVCKCPSHGLYSGMRHGWGDCNPQCPKCLEDLATKVLTPSQQI